MVSTAWACADLDDFSTVRVNAWSPIERLHIVNSMSVLDNTGRRGGTCFYHCCHRCHSCSAHPHKGLPNLHWTFKAQGDQSQPDWRAKEKRERRETLTVEWGSRRYSSFTLLSSTLHLTPPFMKIQIDRRLFPSMLSAVVTPQPHAPGDKATRKGSLFDSDKWTTERKGMRFASPTSLFLHWV